MRTDCSQGVCSECKCLYAELLGLVMQVCEYISAGGTQVWDDLQRVPYVYVGNQWVGFDDPDSIKDKVSDVQRGGHWAATADYGTSQNKSECAHDCLLVGCLMSQQHACVSQGWICSDNLRAATLR